VLALYRRDPRRPCWCIRPRQGRGGGADPGPRHGAELQARSHVLAQKLKPCTAAPSGRRASEDLFTSESALAQTRSELDRLIADRMVLQKSLLTNADAGRPGCAIWRGGPWLRRDLLSRLPKGVEGLGPEPERLVEPVQGRLAARFGQTAARAVRSGIHLDDNARRAGPGPAGGGGRILGAR